MSNRDISRRERIRASRVATTKKVSRTALSWAVTAGIIGASTSAFALITAYPIPQVVSNVTQGFTSLQVAITSDVVVMSNTHPAAIDGTTDSINAAIKLATEQEAMGAKIIANNDIAAKQTLAASYQAGKIQANIAKNLINYGANGQGYAPCTTMAENKVMDTAYRIAEENAKDKVDQTDNAPGRLMPSKEAAETHRASIHNKFCTADEVKQGMKCDGVSPLPAADQNSGILATTKLPGSLASEASVAYRQNVLGKADIALPEAIGQTPAGQAYLMATNRKSALNSFPAMSLAYIEAMNEVNPDLKDKEGKPMSANDALLETVGRYYGGKDAKEWQEKMIQQEPRGLLAEMARMEGLSLWMQFNKHKSYQRLTGNIAALNISTAIPMEEDADQQRVAIQRSAVNSAIRNGNN